MCWKNLKEDCSNLIDSYVFKEAKPLRRKQLIEITAQEFPQMTRMRIAFAVDKYLESRPRPITSRGFVEFIQGYLK
jgi:hypothetical protein